MNRKQKLWTVIIVVVYVGLSLGLFCFLYHNKAITFNLRNSLDKNNLYYNSLTCSIQTSWESCPIPIQKWDALIQSILQNQFLQSNDTVSVYYSSQITFSNEKKVIYRIRERYQLRNEIIYISELDWKRKVSFGSNTREIKVVKTEKEMDYSPCFQDKTMAISECKLVDINQPCRYEHNLCKISQPVVNDMTNLVNALFGMKYFNLTWTTGYSHPYYGKKMMLTEYLIEGQLNDHTTAKDFYGNVEDFYKEQTDWCNCVKKKVLRGSYVEQQKQVDSHCIDLQSIRPEFEAVLDYKMCPEELSRRIYLYNNITDIPYA